MEPALGREGGETGKIKPRLATQPYHGYGYAVSADPVSVAAALLWGH